MKNLLALTICLLFSCAYAQDRGFHSVGREFYLGYLHPSYTEFASAQVAQQSKVFAFVSSFEDNEVGVSYFDPLTKKEGFPVVYPIKARQTTQISLDREQMRMKNPGDVPGEYKSAHIVSRRPVTVQFFSTGANAGGGYLALPVQSWGRSYTVASYEDLNYGNLDPGCGYFMIIAAYDGTTVTIIPTAKTGGSHPGVNQGGGSTGKPQPYTVGLNRGQTWMVKSTSAFMDADYDISASIVKADKPVAVIAGHEDANVGHAQLAGSINDVRDYMVEQMIPTEFWHYTGNIVIPMTDNPVAEEPGDVIRLYVYDKDAPLKVDVEANGSTNTKFPMVYVAYDETLLSPSHFSADSGSRFMVMQYDQRTLGGPIPPNTSPNMMSVVPRAHWRTSYQFRTPASDPRQQSYYVTIISAKDGSDQYHPGRDTVLKRTWTSDSILVSTNAGSPKKLSDIGAVVKRWITVPGHADLMASIYQIGADSSYYFRSPIPFMAYHTGNRSMSATNGPLGDYYEDFFFSYAFPAGTALYDHEKPRRLSVTVDTLCNSWKVCATDSTPGGGIRYVTLIDDEDGDLWPDVGRKFSNATILPPDDDLRHGEFHIANPKQSHCFIVSAVNPSKPTYAPIAIYDNAGNCMILELRSNAREVQLEPDFEVVQEFEVAVGGEVCKEFTFVNLKTNPEGYTFSVIDLPQPTFFKVTEVTPSLPAVINPGDTLRFRVCYTAHDTLTMRDTVVVQSNCLSMSIPLSGHAGTALILAEDKKFGTILASTQRCGDVVVKNVGAIEFVIHSASLLPNNSEFIFDTLFPQNKLPVTIPPGASHAFWVCYNPVNEGIDSATLSWNTNIPSPFNESVKRYSGLVGRGIKPGVFWDRTKQEFRADSTRQVVERVFLINSSGSDAEITAISISGVDASEFSIVATEFNTNPPTFAGSVLSPGDTMWVDVYFKLDMTQQPIDRIHRASLQTAAKLDPSAIKTVELEASFGFADVAASDRSKNIMIRPNPARDRVAVDVNLEGSEAFSIKLFDVLGREIKAASYSGMMPGWNSITLDLQALARGTYIAIITVGEHVETRSLIVE